MTPRKPRRRNAAIFEQVERRLLFTTNAWKNPVSGDWDTAGNWSLGHVPTAGEDVAITVAGTYTVTHSNSLDSDSCASITSNDALVISGGSLTVSGAVQVNNTFTISGGTLVGATVNPGSGRQGITASTPGGTLSGVTLAASLSIPDGANITAVNGLTLNNSTVTLSSTADQTDLYLSCLSTAETVGGNGTIDFAGSSPANDIVRVINIVASATLGSGITVTGSGGQLAINDIDSFGFINQGVIDSAVSGQTMTISAPLENQGTIEAQSGGSIDMTSVWTNDAGHTMSVTGGGSLTLGQENSNNNSSTNAGTITETNSTLSLGNQFTNTGNINRTGGTVNIIGYFNLNNGTLALNSTTGTYVLDGGTLEDGTLTSANGSILLATANGGQLLGMTLASNFNIPDAADVTVVNGLTLNNSTITLSSSGDSTELLLSCLSTTETIGGSGTIDFAGAAPADDIVRVINIVGSATLGSGVTVTGSGGNMDINDVDSFGFINQGLIDSAVSGQTISINAPLENLGTVKAETGGNIDFQNIWANDSSGTLSVTGGSTLTLGTTNLNGENSINSGTIIENASTLKLGNLFTTPGTIQKTGGTIDLIGYDNLGGGSLNLNSTDGPWMLLGGTVENGTVNYTTGDGIIPTTAGGGLQNDTLSSNLDIPDGAEVTVTNGIDLNGTVIRLLGATTSTTLEFNAVSSAETIGGSGQIVFAGTNSTKDQMLAQNVNPVTLGAGITIRGANGNLNVNDVGVGYINFGVVKANVAGGTIIIPAPYFTNKGEIEAAPGTISLIDGAFDATQGTLVVGVGGTTAGSGYGQFTSTGTVTLGGNLFTPLLAGFTPTSGQVFTPFTFVSVSGTFAHTYMKVGGGDGFTFATGATSATLTTTTGGKDFADLSNPALLTINGTNNPDTIALGSSFDIDTVSMNGTINVFFANRVTNIFLEGNSGNDSITSNLSNDTLVGNAGNDTLVGSGGSDTLQGAGGTDSISGNAGNDSLRGGGLDDTVDGGTGNDVVVGGGQDDLVMGGSGNDTVAGGPGNDSVIGDTGTDSLISGLGTDTLDATSGVNDTLMYDSAGDSLIGNVTGDSLVGPGA